MSKTGAGIGAGIGVLIGLIIGLNTPDGLELLPAMNSAPDIVSKVNIAILIFFLSALGSIIGAFGEQIVDIVSGMFK